MDLDKLFSQWFPQEQDKKDASAGGGHGDGEGGGGEGGSLRTSSIERTGSAGLTVPKAKWEPRYDSSMKMFWINQETKSIVWKNPYTSANDGEGEELEEEKDPLITRWTTAKDKASGKTYYFHKDTHEVTWARPLEYEMYAIAVREKVMAEQREARHESTRKRIEQEEEEARRRNMPWLARVLGTKTPTAEQLMRQAEIDKENKARPHDIALRHFKEGMHHVKFEVDTNEPVQGHSVSGGSKDEGGKGEKKTLYDTYEGEFKNYRFDGQGTFIHASGEKYVGGWLKGKQHGKGVKTWPTGNKYAGQYVEDKREGEGEMIYADGSIYRGGWRQGNFHGKGELVFKTDRMDPWPGSCQVFIGEDGSREVSWAVRYVGDFVDGIKNGEGVMTYHDGSSYKGGFFNDTYNGKGRMVWPNGDTYDGEWVGGKQEGEGEEVLMELGETYTGEFVGGERQGKGTLKVKNGWSWTGQFAQGRRKGRGVHVGPNGDRLVGEWWQHAASRNEMPEHVAQTVLSTYALHDQNYTELFPPRAIIASGVHAIGKADRGTFDTSIDAGEKGISEEDLALALESSNLRSAQKRGSVSKHTFFDEHKAAYGVMMDEAQTPPVAIQDAMLEPKPRPKSLISSFMGSRSKKTSEKGAGKS